MMSIVMLAVFAASFCTLVHGQSCALPTVEGIDYGPIEGSCKDTTDVCDACLESIMKNIIAKVPDDALKQAVNDYYKDGFWDVAGITACAMPYAPQLMTVSRLL